MCGIAVLVGAPGAFSTANLVAARDRAAHRGPDDAGMALFGDDGRGGLTLVSDNGPWVVGLGHRRLSIIDVSSAGHQPMRRGRVWIVFNGELYNYRELRSELGRLGAVFVTETDTEVVLAAHQYWGHSALGRMGGMWGYVLVDEGRGELLLCRDRMGIKPLYVASFAGALAIVSEPKQLLGVPGYAARLDRRAADEYLRTGYEDPARSMFADVIPVPAGTVMRIGAHTRNVSAPESYWFPESVQPTVSRPDEAARLFRAKLEESIEFHLRSDVPVGCALSGGLDSTAVAILASRQRAPSASLPTFGAIFPGEAIDERPYMDAALAEIRHPEPHFVAPTPEQLVADLREFVWTHDEPVGSISQYAGYCIARLTRSHGVPVILTGQGGDEILSGYWQSYFLHLRHLATSGAVADMAANTVGAFFGGNPHLWLQAPAMARRYFARRSPGLRLRLHQDEQSPSGILAHVLGLKENERRVHEIRHLFLPRLLKWDDRNFMAFSVEGRYPLLDHELIELCLGFTASTLYRRGWTKMPLRHGLEDVLPPEIGRRRTKFGLETPQDKWLAGPLRLVLAAWVEGDRPLWSCVDRAAVKRLVDGVTRRERGPSEDGHDLFRAFLFDHWLERFAVVI